jgi:hypothetical protein
VRSPVRKICLFAMALTSSALLNAGPPSWSTFWKSVNVAPPPPADFLDRAPFQGNFLNLTHGRLSDAIVTQWIEADLRRGQGDRYATNNLRRDIADAGIFGPPGLNGTSVQIDDELAKHVVRVEATGDARTIAAAVIWLSKEEQRANPHADLTDYVIVQVRRATGKPRVQIYRSGASAPLGKPREPGELTWQLDTGHFFVHPVLGPLWYQQNGWACHPDDGTQLGEICGRVAQHRAADIDRPVPRS